MSLLKPLATVSITVMFSRILGLVRDVVIAQVFGAGATTDAFLISFKLPNLLRRIFAEGAFSQVFIPILSKYKNQQSKETIQTFISHVAGVLILGLLLITVSGMLLAPKVIMIFAPGFTDTQEKVVLTSTLLRIIFPYVLFISLASLVGSILNTWRYFSVTAFSPIILNINMIVFSLFATQYFQIPIIALAWSVVIGGIMQLCYQLPFLNKVDLLVLPNFKFHDDRIYKMFRMMWPAILAGSVSQLSIIINTIFASFLVSGSISWMYYADRLIELPSGVLGVSLGTILLPLLSSSFSKGNYDEYSRLLDYGLRLCFILAIPSTAALGILSKPLISAIFQYGKFSSFDALMTQRALIAYSIGITGLLLIKVLTPGFYSCQDIKTPSFIAIITFIVTQLMNLLLVGPLKHVGLSLSIGLGACLNASLLYWQIRRKQWFKPQPGWFNFFLKLFLATAIMSIVLSVLLIVVPINNLMQNNMPYRILCLIGKNSVGVITYLIILWLNGFRLKII